MGASARKHRRYCGTHKFAGIMKSAAAYDRPMEWAGLLGSVDSRAAMLSFRRHHPVFIGSSIHKPKISPEKNDPSSSAEV